MNASRHSRSRTIAKFFLWIAVIVCATAFLLAIFWPRTRAYLQAAAVLTQLNGNSVPKLLRPIASLPLTTRDLTIPSPAGPVLARLYTPIARPGAPGLVLVPGIHYLGIDEPRLVAFARSLAGCGLRVLTPELPDSRDYRIIPGDVPAIGDAVQWLQRATGHRVGLMGLSFSGGLALMAAARPPYSGQLSFVFAVGAHDDLYRVATFYATGADPLPDGNVERETPNNYGPWIVEYEHLEDFVTSADIAAIRAALRARLYNNPVLEKQMTSKLTSEQRKEYSRVLDAPHQAWALALSNKKHAAKMAAVSPHGHLAGLHVPVYLLHGRGDNLIPFAESEWLVRDLPHRTLKVLLVSPLISHVGTLPAKAGLWEKWQLLHLLAQVIDRAEHP